MTMRERLVCRQCAYGNHDLCEGAKCRCAVNRDINVSVLVSRHAKLGEELDALRADMKYAAGECVVELPEPGTDASKLLSANVILRARHAKLRAAAEAVVEDDRKNSTPIEGALTKEVLDGLMHEHEAWKVKIKALAAALEEDDAAE